MLTGTCHCGAIQIEVPGLPEWIIDCNCSICRRYGALWALWEPGAVRVVGHPENTIEYIWGPKTLRTLRCRTCGCVTHWEMLQPEPNSQIGVNMRNFDQAALKGVRVRQFDGADTWAYLDGD
jgi:hypothetical protein